MPMCEMMWTCRLVPWSAARRQDHEHQAIVISSAVLPSALLLRLAATPCCYATSSPCSLSSDGFSQNAQNPHWDWRLKIPE